MFASNFHDKEYVKETMYLKTVRQRIVFALHLSLGNDRVSNYNMYPSLHLCNYITNT